LNGLLIVFFGGLIVSFLGTLPLGTLNVAAMQIGIQESIPNALYFSFGCIVTEMIYVRVSLIGVTWIRKQKKLIKWLEWVTLAIVIALAIGSFVAADKGSDAKNVMLNNDTNRFILGLLLGSVNPAQIPFWLGWSTVLLSKDVLKPNIGYYYLYILGIGIGSVLGNCVFIFGGNYIVEKLNANMRLLNWIIGGIFILAAIIQLVKILWHKDAAEKLNSLDNDSKT
jgi:threonine/homoserine/homoserine lactone efflux protein